MAKSKFRLLSLILPIAIIAILFLGGIGTIIYPFTDGFNKIYDKGSIVFIGVLLLVFALMVYLPAVRGFYTVEIANELITVKWIHKTKYIKAQHIASIQLFTLYGSVWSNNPLSVFIKLDEEKQNFDNKDDAVINLPDGLYKNMHELTKELEENFGSLIKQQNKAEPIPTGDDEVFKGNPLFTFAFFVGLLLTLIAFLVYIFPPDENDKWMILIFLPLSGFSFAIIDLFYFKISADKIIIKNHLLFWYRKEFLIKDIVLLDFFYPGKRSQALRIVTDNRKVSFYCGGSLTAKTWKQLRERLIAVGISFR